MTVTSLGSGDAAGPAPRRHPPGARGAPPRHRPTWVEVDLDAISGNVEKLKRAAGTPLLLAAVKADGYGHGMVPVARAALRGGADWLGVALVEEGEALRAAGVTAPVLMLNEPPREAIPALLAADVTPTVYTPGFLEALDGHVAATGTGSPAVHLKLDTGMRRVGAPEHDWPALFATASASQHVHVQGLMSHLAVADDPADPFTDVQTAAFRRGLEAAGAAGLEPEIVHLANSAATLSRSDHFDMVRPGIAVYGLDPGARMAQRAGLVPALTWWTRVSLVKRLAAGEAIGYGRTWTAERDVTVVTLPVGYGDGVTRRLSNVGSVVLRGRRVPITGRVSMDQTLLAVPDTAEGPAAVAVGDEVALIGGQIDAGGSRAATVTADDWAGWLDTINYEITTTIGSRVPRVHLGGDG